MGRRISLNTQATRDNFKWFFMPPRVKVPPMESLEDEACIAGEILKGIKKPVQCPEFGKRCNPMTPLGAPMVSSEGACSAYFQFSGSNEFR